VLLLHPELDWKCQNDLAASQGHSGGRMSGTAWRRIHLLAPPRNFSRKPVWKAKAHQRGVSEVPRRLQTDGHAHPIILVEEAGEIGLGVPMHDFVRRSVAVERFTFRGTN